MNPHWLLLPQYGACFAGGYFLADSLWIGGLLLAFAIQITVLKWKLIKEAKK